MAKKAKANKRRSKNKNGSLKADAEERKKRLSSLLQQVSSENGNTSKQVINEPLVIKDESLNKVLQRFTASATGADEDDDSKREQAIVRKERADVDNEDPEGSDSFEDQADEVLQNISERQLRLANKPSIAVLKASVPYPELIEWFDCDAQWPYFNAAIKTAHNTVGIPRHWQMKRGYLSGRSMMERKPFELPEIIRQTDIETMRETVPSGNENQAEKLKDITRAKVQPKLGVLDLDYKRLYEAFFTLGKNWKPELLSFGDLYYENRSLDSELEWKQIKTRYRPGYLSETLREALNLTEGMLPPWCHEMNRLGLPKSYPGMKVCGINWEISNLTGAQYGYYPEATLRIPKQKLFGAMFSFEELEDQDAYIDPDPLNESISDDEVSSDANEAEATKTESEIHEKNNSVLVPIDGGSVVNQHYDENRPLFTVLTEDKSNEVDGSTIISSTTSYNITNKRSTNVEEKDDDNALHKKQKMEEEPDFRF
ncbi:Cus1 [Kluyveromyces lactis]|nr:Cus1 [Kluyveromyces lactis]